tara:strand:+ start:1346 stop:2065 length:720 start_codon:yes stop_codon:yes gene_type:complete
LAQQVRVCPFCNIASVIQSQNRKTQLFEFDAPTQHEDHSFSAVNGEVHYEQFTFVNICANPVCRRFTIEHFYSFGRGSDQFEFVPDLAINLKRLPELVPKPIREDYFEAQQIRSLSPKAACTLARRAVQGMIRDFWKISKSSLFLEIDALKDKIDIDTFEAIDSMRQVGNIGAHMEKDIDVIVEVDDGEAEVLIQMVELLSEDWYVAREQKRLRLSSVKAVAQKVANQKQRPKPENEND